MLSHSFFLAARRLLLFVVTLAAVTGIPLKAQDTAVVFVHGLLSDGTTWTNAAA